MFFQWKSIILFPIQIYLCHDQKILASLSTKEKNYTNLPELMEEVCMIDNCKVFFLSE